MDQSVKRKFRELVGDCTDASFEDVIVRRLTGLTPSEIMELKEGQ